MVQTRKLYIHLVSSAHIVDIDSNKFFNMSLRFSSVMFRPYWAKVFIKLISLVVKIQEVLSKMSENTGITRGFH